MNVIASPDAAVQPTHRLLLAAEADRARFAASPLLPLARFMGRGEPPVLADCFPLLGIALSDEGETEMETVLDRLYRLPTLPAVPLVRLRDAEGSAAFLLAELLLGPIAGTAASMRALLGELALIRRERERLMSDFRALEDALMARGGPPVALDFEMEPWMDPRDEDGSERLDAEGLAQLLPVRSAGMCAVALHFSEQVHPAGRLRVELEGVESGILHAAWELAAARIRPGWNVLALPRALDGAARSLRLRLRAPEGAAPAPSLGHPIPQRRFALQGPAAGAHPGYRPLAFRIYAGLPGVRPGGVVAMHAVLPHQAVCRDLVFVLPPELLETVGDATVRVEPAAFRNVEFIAGENSLVCHPLPACLSAARIAGALPVGTLTVQAAARVDHPEGAPTRVALAAHAPGRPADEAVRALAAAVEGEAPVGIAFSGWRTITPAAPASVNLLLPEALAEEADLLLLTLPAAGTVDFAWLKLTDIRVTRRVGGERP